MCICILYDPLFCLCLCVCVRSVSGGSLNPARSLGPALVSRDLEEQWIYLLAPTFGSISGGLFYRILRLQGWSVLPPSQIN